MTQAGTIQKKRLEWNERIGPVTKKWINKRSPEGDQGYESKQGGKLQSNLEFVAYLYPKRHNSLVPLINEYCNWFSLQI